MNVPASLLAFPVNASRSADRFVALLLSAGIGTELARIAITFVVGTPSAPLLASPVTAPVRAPRVNVASIASASLFGRLETSSAQDPNDAPAATGNLKLVGTLAGRDPTVGLALISDEGRPSILKAGESQTGVSLRYVYADHVILSRAGALERLSLERPAPGQGIVVTAATARAPHGSPP